MSRAFPLAEKLAFIFDDFLKICLLLSHRSCFPTLSPFWRSIMTFFPLWMPVCSLNPSRTILSDTCSSSLWVPEITFEIIFELMLLSSWFIMIWVFLVKQTINIFFSNISQCGIVPSILNLNALKILSALRLSPLPVVLLKKCINKQLVLHVTSSSIKSSLMHKMFLSETLNSNFCNNCSIAFYN